VAQLAVALARDLARVHHQTAGDETFADALSHVSCGVQLAARGDARDCGEAYPIGNAISDQDLINRHHFQLMAAHYWEETSGMGEEL
jgi:hypothetical protein